ncbi:hypothetical protein [Herbaspirillum huttiense]|uniref:Uncharacterized protein n=1 Tax=Herbaspirillum huttiense subsp. lycopersici TaxID=3074428 RepID=A0ABU2ESZ9_9BURK|nr:hypothetical protein [Herbaspirillum huttiense]MDR9850883.1 hypothetical protein [Herbaspirillum huttiense SE1]
MTVIRRAKAKAPWASIPNSFAEDMNISEDATAVGLWLACKPEDWRILPKYIQEQFSKRPGKARGREWWARVSRELRNAGYMALRRSKDESGKFSSEWLFSPEGISDDDWAGGGSTDTGSTDTGSTDSWFADNGAASDGKASSGSHSASNQYSLNKHSLTKNSSNKKPPPPGGGSLRIGDLREYLWLEESIARYQDEAFAKILWAEIEDLTAAQTLLDEFAGAIEAGRRGERAMINYPIHWFTTILESFTRGEFTPNFAPRVFARRRERMRAGGQDEEDKQTPEAAIRGIDNARAAAKLAEKSRQLKNGRSEE